MLMDRKATNRVSSVSPVPRAAADQLWSCIRGTAVGGNSRLFYHWQGKNLTDPDWTPEGVAMQADPSLGETAGGIQAPFAGLFSASGSLGAFGVKRFLVWFAA